MEITLAIVFTVSYLAALVPLVNLLFCLELPTCFDFYTTIGQFTTTIFGMISFITGYAVACQSHFSTNSCQVALVAGVLTGFKLIALAMTMSVLAFVQDRMDEHAQRQRA